MTSLPVVLLATLGLLRAGLPRVRAALGRPAPRRGRDDLLRVAWFGRPAELGSSERFDFWRPGARPCPRSLCSPAWTVLSVWLARALDALGAPVLSDLTGSGPWTQRSAMSAARVPGWTGRSPGGARRSSTRVGSLYVVLWFLCWSMAALGAAVIAERPAPSRGAGRWRAWCSACVGTLALREPSALYPDAPAGARAVTCWRCSPLVAVAEGLVFLLPEKAQFSAALVVRRRRWPGAPVGSATAAVQWVVYVAVAAARRCCPPGSLGLAAFGLGTGAVPRVHRAELAVAAGRGHRARPRQPHTQAALAVAEERLRFSRDVHDVLGRRALHDRRPGRARRDARRARRRPRAREQILEVRETAHEALREARELARGYRPLDLDAEIDGRRLAAAVRRHHRHRRPRRPARGVARARRPGDPRGRHQRAAALDRHPRRDRRTPTARSSIRNDGRRVRRNAATGRPGPGRHRAWSARWPSSSHRSGRGDDRPDGDEFVVRVRGYDRSAAGRGREPRDRGRVR